MKTPQEEIDYLQALVRNAQEEGELRILKRIAKLAKNREVFSIKKQFSRWVVDLGGNYMYAGITLLAAIEKAEEGYNE